MLEQTTPLPDISGEKKPPSKDCIVIRPQIDKTNERKEKKPHNKTEKKTQFFFPGGN